MDGCAPDVRCEIAIGPVRVLLGSALRWLRDLPAGSVHCVVTSPPYFGLRDYGLAPEAWPAVEYSPMAGLPRLAIPAMTCCLGLEPNIEAYVGHLVLVLRELRRVLRDDGTLWLNLGDSYAAGGKGGGGSFQKERRAWRERNATGWRATEGIPPKNLLMVPARVALALQADGWILRTDVVWAKRNPLPESIRDRPTRAHEFVFLLSKGPKYFYDDVAVAEPLEHPESSTPDDMRRAFSARRARKVAPHQPPLREGSGNSRRLYGVDRDAPGDHRGHSVPWTNTSGTRNRRDVWRIASQPFRGAHFATMPEELVEPCILAGTSARGCCPGCGAPWERTTERIGDPQADWRERDRPKQRRGRKGTMRSQGHPGDVGQHSVPRRSVGWTPTCSCTTDTPVPCTVIDLFAGSGTVGAVARRHGRAAVLVEAQERYLPLIERRVAAAVQQLSMEAL